MKTIIAVEKIDISSLIEDRVRSVSNRDAERISIREKRIERLTPYIAQALFGMVEIHNQLVTNNSGSRLFNVEIIENANEFVNEQINKETNWGVIAPIESDRYTNVNFKISCLSIWLSDNLGGAIYTHNPVYQIYTESRVLDVEGFLKYLINSRIKQPFNSLIELGRLKQILIIKNKFGRLKYINYL